MIDRRPWIPIVVLLLTPFVPADQAEGVSPRTWRTVGAEGWETAERDSVGVASDGTVGLTAALVPARDLSAFVVWDLLADGKDILAATGDAGALFRISPDGTATEVVHTVQPEITALGRDSRGRVVLGASPDGTLYRLEHDRLTPLADTPETYIWRILREKDGRLLVATGDAGKVYRVAGGDLEVFADLECTHVTGLEPRGEGYVITTESPGRLVALDAQGRQEVLHDAGESELRSPVPLDDGSVLFLANPPASPGALYRLSAEGALEQVWVSGAGFVYSLHRGTGDSFWVTRGEETGSGSVVEIDLGPPVTWMERVLVREPQVLKAILDEGELRWIGTGGQGAVYAVKESGADFGMATSPVQDAGSRARWGAITLESGPAPDGVTLLTRSGNTRVPDAVWSEWSRVQIQGDRGAVPSPPARFLQWRAEIKNREVRLGGIRVVYLPANAAPTITKLGISDLGETFRESSGSRSGLYQNLPGGLRVEFQPQSSREDPSAGDEEAAWARRYRLVTWEASDANGDALNFELSLRGMRETTWKKVVSDQASSPWVWDSATVPDGWYVLRLEVSDKGSNPVGGELTAQRISDPFVVDNTAPRVLDLRVSDRTLSGVAEDAQSPIKRVELALDGNEWTVVFPKDGIPDMPREPFETALETLEPGDHVIVVRVFDLAGNPGTGRVSFRTP